MTLMSSLLRRLPLPSGESFHDLDLEIVKLLAEYEFVRYSERPFRLKSGVESHVYVSGREDLTDHPDLEVLVGKKIALTVWQNTALDDRRQPCLIGLPTAGTVLAQAAAMASVLFDRPDRLIVCHRVMREVLKKHGAHHTWVNGKPDLSRHAYWTVDNVATDGQTKVEAAEKLTEDGYPAKQMPCLIFVDRQQGAIARLQAEGFDKIVVVFKLLDVAYALGELEHWPKKVVTAVEKEIREHQFSSSGR
ncbi:MAG: hypothetical protein WEA04_04190 [Candidatus Andersenbacteria bacterium]